MRPRRRFFPACLLAMLAGCFFFQLRVSRRTTVPLNSPETPAALAKSPSTALVARRDGPSRPTRYPLFEQECSVLAVRDEPGIGPGEFRRAWLVELAPFGRLRVEETWRRGMASAADERRLREVFVAGEILVTPRATVPAETLPAAFARAGAIAWERLPASEVWLVRFPDPSLDTLPGALAAFAHDIAIVQRAEGNGLGQGGLVPNDPRFGEQYQFRNTGQAGGLFGADVRATLAWDTATSAPAVVVAVLDSGIDFVHPDLAGNVYRDARESANGADDDHNGFVDDFRGWDFVNNDNDPVDDHGHGTHVSGAIGARGNNGVGVAGVAWSVQLMPVKVIGADNLGTTAALLSGINYARAKGARIMNLSLINYPFSAAISSAIDAAEAAGVLLVVSAGNSGTNNDVSPNYPSSYPHANVIAVANTTNADVLNVGGVASNYGATTVDLAAPGTNVLSTTRNNSYGLYSGTSMAAPLVAGAAALLCGLRPNATVLEQRHWLLASADRIPALSGKCATGARLNLAAALQLALDTPPAVAPTLAAQPQSQAVWAGQSVAFSVSAAGTPAPVYQWRKDGVLIVGATDASLALSNVPFSAAGSYSVTVSNSAGSVTSSAVTLTVRAVSRLTNLSIRTRAGTSDETLIVGFVIGGAGTSGTKPVLLRGIGPALEAFGVPGALADPALGLFNASGRISGIDNWNGTALVASVTGSVGAFPLDLPASKDAALYSPATISDAYSMQISGVGSTTGIALAEIYDATPAADFTAASPRLINISARARSGSGAEVMIAGFVIAGDGSKTVLVRVIGPTLRTFGLNEASEDPKLELFNGPAKIGENNDWGGGVALRNAFSAVGAFSLETTSRDAALLATLSAGSYTVQVNSATGGSGIVLVEIYELP